MELKKLIIFAKQPRQGNVKTRLAKSIGEKKTLEVYLELLSLTNVITNKLDVTKIVYWDEIPENPNLYFGEGFQHKLQSSGDLGKKMESAFQLELSQNPCKTLIIGTDCPYLSLSTFEKAYTQLENKEIVLGPAMDGGYYLLGMNELFTEIFSDIPWSTESVLSMTIQRIQENNKSYALLETLNDIDTIDDWNQWKLGV
ncbi:MAG: TIGR04282 family arsenosugar biosynthesis glycosyltransferase [Leptospira bouyouniensis]